MTSRSERLQLARKRRRRRIKLGVTAMSLTLAALFAFVVGGSGSGAGAAPQPGGYFQLLPPGSPLPTDAQCAARVHRSSWEPRPDNYQANHTLPSGPKLGNFTSFNALWNSTYATRIDGNFTGTTDEIIQWAACKWGWSDDLVRAEAVIESTWRQSTVGDGSTSYGLMQVRYLYHPRVNGGCKDCAGSSWPNSANSTAFNVDLFLAEMRGCYDGLEPYLGNTRGDQWGCIGSWFSGAWRTSSALGYVSKVQSALNNKDWLSWPDQSGSLPATPAPQNVPTTTAAPTTTTRAQSGGTQPPIVNQQPVTTTTAKPSAQTGGSPPPKPTVTTTTTPTVAAKAKSHSNELRRLRKELNAYCKKNGC
jgi:hypothetical protein